MKFDYSIPLLGSVEISLDNHVESFYRILEEKNEINRLQSLSHLGVLQETFPGMRHTQWDYIVTMLYVIQQLNKAKLEGLSRENKIKGFNLSGRDMMQLLILVTSIGHIPGTFAVEKGIMKYFIKHDDLAKKIIKLVSLDKDNYKNMDYLSINKLFMRLKLQLWIDDTEIKSREKKIIEMVKELTQQIFFSVSKTKHKEKIWRYFNLIRRVSYQFLDCLYVNLPIRIDYLQFINRLSISSNIKEKINTISNLVDQYTRIVYEEVYHSNKGGLVTVAWADKVFNILTKKKKAFETITNWLESSELSDISKQFCYNEYLIFSCILPHKFSANFLTELFQTEQVEKLEIEISELLGQDKVLILYIPALKDLLFSEEFVPGDLLFRIYVHNNTTTNEVWRIFALLVAWIHDRFKSHFGVGLLVKSAMESILYLLVSNPDFKVVTTVANKKFFKEDENIFIPEDRCQIFRASQPKETLQLFVSKEKKGWDSTLREEFHECKTLMEVIKENGKKFYKKMREYQVILPGRIKFVDIKKNKDVCEFDGAFLTIAARGKKIHKMTLFLVEAKLGSSASSPKAKNELEKKLKKIEVKNKLSISKLKKGAYVKIDLI